VHADNDKIYVVLEGAGRFEVGGEAQTLGPVHAVYVPPGVSHGVSNPGPARLKLLVFVAPAIAK
jgi:mannose-6-phosphate isomerase-like protein (cupin superfamily)